MSKTNGTQTFFKFWKRLHSTHYKAPRLIASVPETRKPCPLPQISMVKLGKFSPTKLLVHPVPLTCSQCRLQKRQRNGSPAAYWTSYNITSRTASDSQTAFFFYPTIKTIQFIGSLVVGKTTGNRSIMIHVPEVCLTAGSLSILLAQSCKFDKKILSTAPFSNLSLKIRVRLASRNSRASTEKASE